MTVIELLNSEIKRLEEKKVLSEFEKKLLDDLNLSRKVMQEPDPEIEAMFADIDLTLIQ